MAATATRRPRLWTACPNAVHTMRQPTGTEHCSVVAATTRKLTSSSSGNSRQRVWTDLSKSAAAQLRDAHVGLPTMKQSFKVPHSFPMISKGINRLNRNAPAEALCLKHKAAANACVPSHWGSRSHSMLRNHCGQKQPGSTLPGWSDQPCMQQTGKAQSGTHKHATTTPQTCCQRLCPSLWAVSATQPA